MKDKKISPKEQLEIDRRNRNRESARAFAESLKSKKDKDLDRPKKNPRTLEDLKKPSK